MARKPIRKWWRNFVNAKIRYARLTYLRSKMKLDLRFSPDLEELNQEEVEMLGELSTHPHWPIFIKYLHIERWATMNNGFIAAKDGVEFGYCQGDIGRINKIQTDMERYGAIASASSQVKNMTKEHDQVVSNAFVDYDDDEDLPLSP